MLKDFLRAVHAEIGCHISRVQDAVGHQRAIGLTDADLAELAAEKAVGTVDLAGAVGLRDILAVEPDQQADGHTVVECRLAGEVDADLLAHRHGLAVEIAQARR